MQRLNLIDFKRRINVYAFIPNLNVEKFSDQNAHLQYVKKKNNEIFIPIIHILS